MKEIELYHKETNDKIIISDDLIISVCGIRYFIITTGIFDQLAIFDKIIELYYFPIFFKETTVFRHIPYPLLYKIEYK